MIPKDSGDNRASEEQSTSFEHFVAGIIAAVTVRLFWNSFNILCLSLSFLPFLSFLEFSASSEAVAQFNKTLSRFNPTKKGLNKLNKKDFFYINKIMNFQDTNI